MNREPRILLPVDHRPLGREVGSRLLGHHAKLAPSENQRQIGRLKLRDRRPAYEIQKCQPFGGPQRWRRLQTRRRRAELDCVNGCVRTASGHVDSMPVAGEGECPGFRDLARPRKVTTRVATKWQRARKSRGIEIFRTSPRGFWLHDLW